MFGFPNRYFTTRKNFLILAKKEKTMLKFSYKKENCMILDKVNTPSDVKKLTAEEMKTLASEIREFIIKKVNVTSGHMGPNLGFVEATIALHYVFNSPVDKIIYDVSHQSYPHKFLTGRKEGFTNPESYLKYTGYTAPEESEHDLFKVGHTSTSISLAVGVAKARDLKGDKENVIAVIGDGSMSGGEALEGLNNASVLNSNLIILFNDNQMSIAENHGGLYKNFELLRNTKGEAELNLFKSMGFEYYYLDEGNDIEKLIDLFNKVKDTSKPTILHIKTLKGMGLKLAEENKELYHYIMPGMADKLPTEEYETNWTLIRDYLGKKAKEDKTINLVTAGTPGATAFGEDFRKSLGNQYTDVGIAEQHAVGYISGMAKNGAKPVYCVLSSFIQRTYDQLSQDLALNNAPATILVAWAGISNADATHLGTFDIPLISNIPNIVYLAPTNREEMYRMIDYSVEQNEHPVAIRIPLNLLKETKIKDDTDYSILNTYRVINAGRKVAIIGTGDFLELAYQVEEKLKERGMTPTVINPRYLTGLDYDLLEFLKTNHELVITLENGELEGGFGEKIARFYGNSDMKVLNFGSKKEFTDRTSMDELLKRYHLTPDLIVQDILDTINKKAVV